MPQQNPITEWLLEGDPAIRWQTRRDLQNKHPGRTFFELETVGQPSRWNTLRALRLLKWSEAYPLGGERFETLTSGSRG